MEAAEQVTEVIRELTEVHDELTAAAPKLPLTRDRLARIVDRQREELADLSNWLRLS